MAPFSMLVVYIIVWWLVLFMVLPIGIRSQIEDGDVVEGSEPGAPVDSAMKRKVILTTIIATLLWVIICAVIIFDLVQWPGLSSGAVN